MDVTGFMGFPVMNALYGPFGVFCMAIYALYTADSQILDTIY